MGSKHNSVSRHLAPPLGCTRTSTTATPLVRSKGYNDNAVCDARDRASTVLPEECINKCMGTSVIVGPLTFYILPRLDE